MQIIEFSSRYADMRFDKQEIKKTKTSLRKLRKVRNVSFAGQIACFPDFSSPPGEED
jgi:hypothetical protein